MIEDYNKYHFSWKELLLLVLKGVFLSLFFGYLFYNSLPGMLVLLPFAALYIRGKREDFIRKRKWQVNMEFKDGMACLTAALTAGYSAENAFSQAAVDLRQIYGEGALIIGEFNSIVKKLHMNRNLEEILKDFGKRSDVEDIKIFAEVFQTAKRSGGDIIRIMKNTESSIREKIEVENDIRVMVAGKKLEAQIMNIMPCGIICYLRIFSPGFLDPLYQNTTGIFIMTTVLAVYYGIIRLTKKLTDIRV